MTRAAEGNQSFVDFWSDIATPKWIRFRHLLSGNGKIHSDLAAPTMKIERGGRILDVGWMPVSSAAETKLAVTTQKRPASRSSAVR